jgi:serine/threonine protein kinase
VRAQVITCQPCCWRPAADWWCVGVTLFYLLTGALPFYDEDEKEPDPKYERL